MDAPHRHRLRSLVPTVLLALVVVALGALSLARKIPTFQPLGFAAEAAAGHWRVTEVTAEASGLATGDQILLVNGQEAGAIGDLRAALAARPASELLVQRGAGLEQVTHALPGLAIDYPFLVLALIGAAYLLIGFYTRWRDRRRAALIFYLWCVTSALLYLLSPVGPYDAVGKTIFLLDGVARILLAPLTLHLFLIFPRPLGGERKLGRWVPFLYLPAAFLLALQADLAFFNGVWLLGGAVEATPIIDQIELYHLVLFSLVAGAALAWRLRRSKHDEPFRQAKWIAVGIAGGYLPFLALYLLPRTFELAWPTPVTTVAVLPLALVPLTFAWAILRYKLWDIGVLVRDTVSLSLTVLVGVIGFSLANLVINRVVPDDLALARTAVTFVSGVLIAGLLIPTRKGIQDSLERLQYGSGYGKRRALTEFGREILEERSLGRLSASLVGRLRSALEIGRVALLLAHDDRLRPVQPQARPLPKLGVDDFEPDFWQAEMEVLSAVEFPSAGRTAKQDLFVEGFRYAFPLQVRGKPQGVLLVGYKNEDTPLNSEDTDLVRNLLNQAALAIDNARLLDQVHHQLEEMVRLQRFSQGVIESSPAGIAVVDESGKVRSANHAFGALVERPPAELVGVALGALLPLEPLPTPGEGIREVSLTDSEGRERYLQVTAAPLAEEESEGLRIVVVQDVSERHDMENALKEKERLAALGMLAAGVAHEVNTPITGISSYAQMLITETAEDDPRRDLLKKVERQTFRAARIVNNLLEFARDRQRDRAPAAIGPLMDECLELLADRFAEHAIELDWQRPVDDVVVLANDGELQQVFTNLVLNAIDALAGQGSARKSGRRIGISLEADEQWVTVAVEDNGPGISPQELDKIFQPFFSTKLSKGGTGLGLSISFNIVRRHGGELRVVSHPGEGARFLVELPRHRPEAGA